MGACLGWALAAALESGQQQIPFIIVLAGLLAIVSTSAQAESWPGWRGPRGDGTCLEAAVSSDWDPAGAHWKIEIPGQGHASPIVWGDRVCTVTASAARQERVILCLDRASGNYRHQTEVIEKILRHCGLCEESRARGPPVPDVAVEG